MKGIVHKIRKNTLLIGVTLLALLVSGCRTSAQATEIAPATVAAATGIETMAATTDINSSTDMPITIRPYILEGTESPDCEGNLIRVNDAYYTMTETGPKQVDLQNIHTTVELYGIWEVDLDYAVLDGELAFHNNTSTECYAIIDGKKVTQTEYILAGRPATTVPIEWIDPAVAVALPLEGSADTVILRIFRTDQPATDRVAYVFLYNVLTGKITDPLANVPELFNHGNFSSAIFNNAVTRAIVDVFDAEGILESYVCNLTTGDMTAIDKLAAPYIPEAENPEVIFTPRSDFCTWADDDTLLFWIQEQSPNGNEEGYTEDGEYISPWDYCYWLCSYNLKNGTMNYQKRNVEFFVLNREHHHPNLQCIPDDRSGFQVVDTATGANYYLDMHFESYSWEETSNRAVINEGNAGIYLVDDDQMSWTNLSDYLEFPERMGFDMNTPVQLVTNNWLCLITDNAVYCYHIPEDMPMTMLTAK